MFTHASMTDDQPGRPSWQHFLIYYLPPILFAAVIIGVSSIPNLTTPEFRVIAFDKLAHLIEYAVFAFLVYRAFVHRRGRARADRAIWYAALVVALFAVFDETYQRFVPGRFGSGFDIAADLLGAFLILAFFEVRRRRLRK